ncbi:MAG TPA: hypothetical protein VE988_17950 [Gemmataceae bacterium]|nr:hypothetical protein [Gemmataceae bacterium]
MNPLRPELYLRLVDRFGRVEITNNGEEMVCEYRHNWFSYQGKSKSQLRLEVIHPGEYYKINCPFCNDTRCRLWVNYRWGLMEPRLGRRLLWLAHCFNDNCLSERGRAWELWNFLFGDTTELSCDVVRKGIVATAPAAILPPGQMTLLHELPADHPAYLYVKARGFDPVVLGRELCATYCECARPEYYRAQGRLVVPIFMNGNLAGWQARSLLDEGMEGFKHPKWYSCSGMKAGQLLYNFDVARTYPIVVVCEGITDVWRVGPCAVAALGHRLSHEKLQLLKENWRSGTLIMMLDNDGANHSAQDLNGLYFDNLRPHFAAGAVRVTLPENTDPADLSRDQIWTLITSEARQHGVRLPLQALGTFLPHDLIPGEVQSDKTELTGPEGEL